MPLLEPLTDAALHVAIDMQRLFADETVWHTPALAEILPNVVRLTEAMPDATIFARFVVPHTAEAATGRWKRYYERWSAVTGEAIAPGLLDVVEPLARFVTPSNQIEKFTYSIFEAEGAATKIAARGTDTLIFTGVETDVCVLASLMGAVDRGYRVIAVSDALASASAASHDAVLRELLTRLSDQVEIADTDEILAALRQR